MAQVAHTKKQIKPKNIPYRTI